MFIDYKNLNIRVKAVLALEGPQFGGGGHVGPSIYLQS